MMRPFAPREGEVASTPAMHDAEAPTPLAGVFPPRLVARLHRERFEGTLRLHGGGATRVIYFRRGEIASAASNADEDRLPNILIREGRLTGPQVEMARAKQRPGVSLGKTLIELGFLTPAELLQGARRQVRQILAAAFALRDGTSQASPGPLPPEVTVLGLPVRRLIFDALLEAGDRQVVVQEMGSMETVYRPSPDLELALPALRLESQHEEVARLVDGQATLREISGRVRLDDLTVSKIVLALEILGLVAQETPRLGTGAGRRIPVVSDEPAEEPPLEPAVTVAPEPVFAPPVAAEPPLRAVEPPPAVEPRAVEPQRSVEPPRTTEPPRPPEPEAAPFEPRRTEPAWLPSPKTTGVAAVSGGAPYSPFDPGATPAATPAASDDEFFDSSEPESIASRPVREPAPGSENASRFGSAPAPAAIAFEEEDDAPPIPPGELPAFAAPPNAPTGWSIDPETGEKVHLGPIELTFDGPVVPPANTGVGRRRLALFGAAGLLGVAAVVAIVVLRGNGASEPAGRSPEEIASSATGGGASPQEASTGEPGAPAADAATDEPVDPAPVAPEEATEEQDTAPSLAPSTVGAPAPATGAAPSTAVEPAPPAGTQAAPSAPQNAAPSAPGTARPPTERPAAAPGAEPSADRPTAPATGGFGFGQRLLDAGTIDRAAEAFKSALQPIPSGRFTLQMMIACEAESVRKARAGTRPDAGLFVLPVAVRGRGCYRVMWGVFETRAAADSGKGDLPKYFVSSGVTPAVVPIDRLRSPS